MKGALASAILLVAVLAPLAAEAHGGHEYRRQTTGPTGVSTRAFSTPGCYPEGTLRLDCTTFAAAAIVDVSDLDPSNSFAYGSCSVRPVSAAEIPFTGHGFTCGVDRDDDNLLTRVDLFSADPDSYDDDSGGMAVRPGQDTLDVCFRRDVAQGGRDWDEVLVFVELVVPAPPPAAIFYDVEVKLTDASACRSGEVASGHTHADYYYD